MIIIQSNYHKIITPKKLKKKNNAKNDRVKMALRRSIGNNFSN